MPITKKKHIKRMNDSDIDEREDDIMTNDETQKEPYAEETYEEVTDAGDVTETVDSEDPTAKAEDTPEEIEYPEMLDGTDIRNIAYKYRKSLSKLEKIDIQDWYQAKLLRQRHEDQVKFCSKSVNIIPGDYIFPYTKSQYYFGYILDVKERIYNGIKNLYLYVAIGNEIKTVKCVLGAFNDVVSKALKQKFGYMFTTDQLTYWLVRIKVNSKTDEEGYIVYSEIVKFEFLDTEYEDKFLYPVYKCLNDKIL